MFKVKCSARANEFISLNGFLYLALAPSTWQHDRGHRRLSRPRSRLITFEGEKQNGPNLPLLSRKLALFFFPRCAFFLRAEGRRGPAHFFLFKYISALTARNDDGRWSRGT